MILVTRPSPEGEKLTELFNQANLPAQHLPFFKISQGRDILQLQHQLNQLLPQDIVIVVSPQVTHVINQYFTNLTLPKNISYFAIGKKSAQLFKQFTEIEVNYPDREDSEGLLVLLQQQSVKQRNILILCGNSSRPLLAQTLRSRQAKVKLIECYSRTPIIYQPDILSEHISQQLIIITSIEHLNQLESYSSDEHKKQSRLLVTSQRIFTKAKELTWQNVLLVNSADNQTVFNAVKQHFPTPL
ncbi:hypothetical protein A9G17_11800 [Gilliamella sp. wkB7]|uniref:uroporphyrinogen-III synthase n=1 Tax=Gilliamella sp. wkB7 TaxID=3120264 RepID=UPI000810747D|nr:uroporphyrinogen-III synthase [Gilliamella apicola]OCF93747.1 hypothetical protein A9G17_11800 [Gilliamella apicola]